jgi:hypothetical protein
MNYEFKFRRNALLFFVAISGRNFSVLAAFGTRLYASSGWPTIYSIIGVWLVLHFYIIPMFSLLLPSLWQASKK